jgi:hypothetical protein
MVVDRACKYKERIHEVLDFDVGLSVTDRCSRQFVRQHQCMYARAFSVMKAADC